MGNCKSTGHVSLEGGAHNFDHEVHSTMSGGGLGSFSAATKSISSPLRRSRRGGLGRSGYYQQQLNEGGDDDDDDYYDDRDDREHGKICLPHHHSRGGGGGGTTTDDESSVGALSHQTPSKAWDVSRLKKAIDTIDQTTEAEDEEDDEEEEDYNEIPTPEGGNTPGNTPGRASEATTVTAATTATTATTPSPSRALNSSNTTTASLMKNTNNSDNNMNQISDAAANQEEKKEDDDRKLVSPPDLNKTSRDAAFADGRPDVTGVVATSSSDLMKDSGSSKDEDDDEVDQIMTFPEEVDDLFAPKLAERHNQTSRNIMKTPPVMSVTTSSSGDAYTKSPATQSMDSTISSRSPIPASGGGTITKRHETMTSPKIPSSIPEDEEAIPDAGGAAKSSSLGQIRESGMSDVDSTTQQQYHQAVELLHRTLIKKEVTLNEDERSFLQSLLSGATNGSLGGSKQSTTKSGSVRTPAATTAAKGLSKQQQDGSPGSVGLDGSGRLVVPDVSQIDPDELEERLSAVESATHVLERDPLFSTPEPGNNNNGKAHLSSDNLEQYPVITTKTRLRAGAAPPPMAQDSPLARNSGIGVEESKADEDILLELQHLESKGVGARAGSSAGGFALPQHLSTPPRSNSRNATRSVDNTTISSMTQTPEIFYPSVSGPSAQGSKGATNPTTGGDGSRFQPRSLLGGDTDPPTEAGESEVDSIREGLNVFTDEDLLLMPSFSSKEESVKLSGATRKKVNNNDNNNNNNKKPQLHGSSALLGTMPRGRNDDGDDDESSDDRNGAAYYQMMPSMADRITPEDIVRSRRTPTAEQLRKEKAAAAAAAAGGGAGAGGARRGGIMGAFHRPSSKSSTSLNYSSSDASTEEDRVMGLRTPENEQTTDGTAATKTTHSSSSPFSRLVSVIKRPKLVTPTPPDLIVGEDDILEDDYFEEEEDGRPHVIEEEEGAPSSVADYEPYLNLGIKRFEMQKMPLILNRKLQQDLREFLPLSLTEENYWLKYKLGGGNSGDGLVNMLHAVRASKFTLLVIQSTDGQIFGALTGSAWRKQRGWYGSGQSFLWKYTVTDSRDYYDDGTTTTTRKRRSLQVFPFTGSDACIQSCTTAMLAVGGGEWKSNTSTTKAPDDDDDSAAAAGISPYGPSQSLGFGLVLDADLRGGESHSCQTFCNPTLTGSGSPEFTVDSLELWTFTPCMTEDEATRMELHKLFVEQHRGNSSSSSSSGNNNNNNNR